MYDVHFLAEHLRLSRRYFLQAGAIGATALASRRLIAADEPKPEKSPPAEKPTAEKPPMPEKRVKPDKAGAWADPYFTRVEDFRDVSRGKPVPHSLDDDKRREVG